MEIKKPKRRMNKSPFQLKMLEDAYTSDKYPSVAARTQLSKSVGLTDRQLQMWFCHRRIKDKKERKEIRVGWGSKELLKFSKRELGVVDYGSLSCSGFSSSSSSSSSSGSDSSHFNEPLVNSRACGLTQQNTLLRSLVDCVEVELGKRSSRDGPEEETQDLEEDSETEEETQVLKSVERCGKFPSFQKVERPKRKSVVEKFPSFEEVERPKCKSKTSASSTSTDTQVLMQLVSKLNSYFEQDAEKLAHFRSEKLRIKEEEKQTSVRTLEAKERLFQKQERSLERQEKKEDLEFFLKPHDHLSGPMLRVMLKQKQEVAEKWGWEWE